jgi:hypothetical protein
MKAYHSISLALMQSIAKIGIQSTVKSHKILDTYALKKGR